MLTTSVRTLADTIGGEIIAGSSNAMVNGVTIDSRHVEPGNAFVAFSGLRHDGHDFLGDAISLGARVLVVTRADSVTPALGEYASARGVAIVCVPHALSAIQALATYHRSRLFCPVIGVTGSTGKTTTKDFITAVLSHNSLVVATEGTQNNELGVPLTLFRAGPDTDAIVVEMGMRGEGQIAELASIARPTIGLITNIGTSHIELLGSRDAIARAKAELARAIEEDGAVFLNGDDAYSERIATEVQATVITYGLGQTNGIRAENIELDSESRPAFDLVTDALRRRITLQLPGRHNVYNALAAAGVGLYLGMDSDDIADGLHNAIACEMRMQSFFTASGIHVINDAYNANPTSMRAAIETLSEITSARRRIAVLGDMAELGSLTELAHFRIGEEVARINIDFLVTVGERAKRIADGARAEESDGLSVRACLTPEEASEVLDDLLEPGDTVLVKASRVMGLERIVEGIVTPRA